MRAPLTFDKRILCEKISTMNNILYGGYEGSDKEITENVQSLGEMLFKKLNTAGQSVVLVKF